MGKYNQSSNLLLSFETDSKRPCFSQLDSIIYLLAINQLGIDRHGNAIHERQREMWTEPEVACIVANSLLREKDNGLKI